MAQALPPKPNPVPSRPPLYIVNGVVFRNAGDAIDYKQQSGKRL